jgi:hypothetical protein
MLLGLIGIFAFDYFCVRFFCCWRFIKWSVIVALNDVVDVVSGVDVIVFEFLLISDTDIRIDLMWIVRSMVDCWLLLTFTCFPVFFCCPTVLNLFQLLLWNNCSVSNEPPTARRRNGERSRRISCRRPFVCCRPLFCSSVRECQLGLIASFVVRYLTGRWPGGGFLSIVW